MGLSWLPSFRLSALVASLAGAKGEPKRQIILKLHNACEPSGACSKHGGAEGQEKGESGWPGGRYARVLYWSGKGAPWPR